MQGQGKENKAGTKCVAFRRSMKPVIDIRQPKQAKSTNKEEKKPSYQEDNRKDIEDRSEPAYNQSRAPFSRYLAIPIVVTKLIKA